MHKRRVRNGNISKNKMWESTYLVHTLQALVANSEAFDDSFLNLHELNIVNLVRDGVRALNSTGMDIRTDCKSKMT